MAGVLVKQQMGLLQGGMAVQRRMVAKSRVRIPWCQPAQQHIGRLRSLGRPSNWMRRSSAIWLAAVCAKSTTRSPNLPRGPQLSKMHVRPIPSHYAGEELDASLNLSFWFSPCTCLLNIFLCQLQPICGITRAVESTSKQRRLPKASRAWNGHPKLLLPCHVSSCLPS